MTEPRPTLPALLRDLVARFGPRPLCVLGEQRITYAEADALSARLARGLLAQGVAKGARVAVLFPNGPDFIVAWLAAARIGAVVVPLNTFYKPRELGYVLRHADVHTLLTTPRLLGNDYLERLEVVAPSLARERESGGALFLGELPHLRAIFVFGDPGARAWAKKREDIETDGRAVGLDDAFLAAVEAEVAPADPAVLVYSSGSMADPKGALHSHGTLVRHSANLNQFRDLRADDRIFSPMPFFWVGGLVFSLLSTLQTGALLICEEFFEPGATLALLERERATIAAGWPHYSKAMAEHPSFASRDLSSIRSGNLYTLLPASARPKDPELRSNSLGMTETCGPHTIDRMDVDLPEKLRGSFGHAVPGVEHKIVDPKTGATLPPGESGEICVRGYSLMLGLHKQERDETFDRDGFYHTGDVGRFDAEGHLFFEARLGDLIKTAGANVAPREVEVLLEAMPEVSSAYVVGLADGVRGQKVAAALVLTPGAHLDTETVRERLKKDLSSYKLPRHVFCVAKEELPFTDSGKIDKRKLAPLLEARVRADTRAR
ncbi:MAG TPA: class I adenylate-forming enzyme family protein [Myxococcota bacterium]|nr:class I adenylate-forming enzyme family protein [Myxococcota bacterium]